MHKPVRAAWNTLAESCGLEVDELMRREVVQQVQGRIRFDEPMNRHTSFKVGGPADILAEPADEKSLLELLRISDFHNQPITILGGGTNVLYSDKGVRGVVLSLRKGFAAIELEENAYGSGIHRLVVGGGLGTFKLLKFCRENLLQGMEYLAGVPGTMGGAVRMNAGTYAGEIVNNCQWVRKVTWGAVGQIVKVSASEMGFEYRHSNLAPREIVISAAFKVCSAADDSFLADLDGILERRKATQPVHLPNAGSIFKNPPGDYAGRLIEAAGLKGFSQGGAQVSPMHANFIVNTGNATASDVRAVAEHVRKVVKDQSGIELEWEVKLMGDWGEHG
ncbi:MAG TPA: UDP-N-acetylmuramate dehydrogenase [Myxococcales bacterium]|nr:UDP-N-acetylmuramate dehydrogenase [Myxococcales bacterium]